MTPNLFDSSAPFHRLLEEYNEILERMGNVSRDYKSSVSNIAELLSSQFPQYGRITSALGREVHYVMRKHQENNSTEPIDWNKEMPRIIDKIDKEFDI